MRQTLLSRRAQVALWAAAAVLAGVSGAGAQQRPGRVEPAGIPVRFPEGMAHGFVDLHTIAGAPLAHGDLLQVAKGNGMESRLVFHFLDNSVFEETSTYTQHGVFKMQTYHIVQRGPAFAEDLDATLKRSGEYVVHTRSHKDGKSKDDTGTLELPPDISNGLVITLVKNLVARDTQTVHIVAFTPKPMLIELEFVPSGSERVMVGNHPETAVHFILKPRLGALTTMMAKLTGQMPPDSHAWVISDDVPAFLRFEGPMYSGPVWRLDLTSPTWPR